LFGESPAPARFAEACALLAEASLVEYQDEALGLTSGGRRLLRRAGTMKAAERPERLLSLLRQLDEGDLAPEGSVPAPTAEAVAAALADLDHDLESGNAPVRGDLLAPNPSSTWGTEPPAGALVARAHRSAGGTARSTNHALTKNDGLRLGAGKPFCVPPFPGQYCQSAESTIGLCRRRCERRRIDGEKVLSRTPQRRQAG